MKFRIERLVLGTVMVFCLAASGCYVSTGTYVGYGYTYNYYDEVFYTSPFDRYGYGYDGYGYGFYGHP